MSHAWDQVYDKYMRKKKLMQRSDTYLEIS